MALLHTWYSKSEPGRSWEDSIACEALSRRPFLHTSDRMGTLILLQGIHGTKNGAENSVLLI